MGAEYFTDADTFSVSCKFECCYSMSLLPDTQNCGLRMRRECRELWWAKRSRHSRRMHNSQLWVLYLVRGQWSHCSTLSFLKWIPTNNSAWPFVSSKSDWCSCFVANVISMGPGGNGSVQGRRNSNALSTELRLSCTKPSIWTIWLYCAVCKQKPTMLAHIFHYCRYYITVAPSHYHHYSGLFGSFEQIKSLSGIFSRLWV